MSESPSNDKQHSSEVNAEQTAQKVLEKYDADARVRSPRIKYITLFIAILAILYSLFYLYVTFNPLPALKQRAVHMAVGMALIFLLYPTFRSQIRAKIPIYDWILFFLSIASFGYLFIEYSIIITFCDC